MLLDAGLKLESVRLVRHQDTRIAGSPSPYQLWRIDDGQLELYQRIQRRTVFESAEMLASFVVSPLGETVFIGLYAVAGVGPTLPGQLEPITNQLVPDHYLYDLVVSPLLAEYSGRVLIEWGAGYRQWVQSALNQPKKIVEIRRGEVDLPFPGFPDFQANLSELAGVPQSWRSVLSSVSGIYLLIHPKSGQQYVGLASGAGGLWARWEQYAVSGHGGNKKMLDLPRADYQVSVLEIANPSTPLDSLAKLENRWKLKLLSRKFGLNGN